VTFCSARAFSALHLLNIGFGVEEFIPDNVPTFGHLDGVAMGL
jgi:hypothetical protein